MRQHGRKSAANLVTLVVDGSPARLGPPASLPEVERAIFVALVDACDPRHFQASDLPLLVQYVQAIVLANEVAEHLRTEGAVVKGKPSPWLLVLEKSQRAVVALSMRLRLSPQSNCRQRNKGHFASASRQC